MEFLVLMLVVTIAMTVSWLVLDITYQISLGMKDGTEDTKS